MKLLLNHLGLGDHLVCQGLVRALVRQDGPLTIPCWRHNLPTLRHMFEDLPEIKFLVVSTEEEMLKAAEGRDVFKLGKYSSLPFESRFWDRDFYHQAGVDFSQRYDGFKIPASVKDGNRLIVNHDYCFLHEDQERGFLANRFAPAQMPTLIPTGFESIFDYVPFIRGAKEVHCIDSCFVALIDSLPACNSQHLFLHKYARQSVPPILRRDWRVLE